MAIQIRNGTNTEWESNNSNIVVGEPAIATDAERFFVGTASGDYAEFANLDIIAPVHDTSTSYVVGDVVNRQGKLYSCNTPCSGAFNVSYWDEKSLAEILKDLENEIDYAQYEIGYASGELITIDNGASEIPVKDLTLDLEAVQDLHGYDHPWVGGAGKNKLEVTGTSTTTQGITFNVSQDGTITVSGTFQTQVNFLINATCYLKAGDYIFNGLPSAPSWTTFQMYITVNGNKYASVSGTQFTVDTDGEYPVYVSIYGAISGTLTFKPMIRLASETDATFEPYSNICPISGWDEVNVTRTGKNLIDSDFLLQARGWTKDSNGVYSGNSKALWDIYKTGVPSYTLKGKQSITVSFYAWNDSALRSIYVYLNYTDGTREVVQVETTTRTLFQIHSNPTKDISNLAISYSNQVITHIDSFQIEQGQVVTDYVPYNGQTYTIDLNGTRYGGTLDVTTGVLTIDKKLYPIETNITYTHPSDWKVGAWYCTPTNNSDMKPISGFGTLADAISNIAPVDTPANIASTSRHNIAIGIGSARNIYLYLGAEYDTQEKIKQVLSDSNAYYVAELATPQVVQLTPTQVRTVLGTNNLWNQMNSNNELAYRISNALN